MDYLTSAELAERLGVHEGTLRNWRSAGKGPRYRKLVGVVRYAVRDVERWEQDAAR